MKRYSILVILTMLLCIMFSKGVVTKQSEFEPPQPLLLKHEKIAEFEPPQPLLIQGNRI